MTQRTNLLVDIAIFAGFLVAFEPALTGVPIHEWFSLALAAALLVHLLLHWEWTVQVTVNYFRKLFHSSRLNYVLNLGLLVAFVTILLSGVLISKSALPALGIQVQASQTWRHLHNDAANIALLLVGLHVALHWKWIVSAVRRYLIEPLHRRRTRPQPLQPVTVAFRKDQNQ